MPGNQPIGIGLVALVITPPFILGFVPILGCMVAKSRWTPIAWAVAISSGVVGYALQRQGYISNPRVAWCLWAPLYQLIVYTVVLNLFLLVVHRRPRYVPYNFPAGYGWDSAFSFVVLMASIPPFMFLLSAM